MLWTRASLTAMTITSSLLSFVAYTLFLRNLGTSSDVDRLFYAASIPLAVAAVVSGALLYLIPPVLIRMTLDVQDSTFRVLVWFCAAATAAACVLAMCCMLGSGVWSFWAMWLGFALVAGLQIVSNIQICVSQARGEYLHTGFAPLVAAVGVGFGALAAIAMHLEWMLLVGQLIGSMVSVFLVGKLLGVSLAGNVRQNVITCVAALAPMRQHAVAITLGTTAFTLFQPIDAVLCSQIGNGCMANMAYAQRVVVALGTAVSLGAYAIAARSSHTALERGGRVILCKQSNREVVRIAMLGVVGWFVYEIVGRYVLGRILGSSSLGRADVARLVTTLQWMLIGLGPMAALPYLFRVFYSLGEYRAAAVFGVTIPPVYGVIGWCFLRKEGALALAAAYVIVWWIGLVASLLWLNRPPAVAEQGLAET